MAAAQIDVPRLAAYASLPEASIDSLLNAPTIELVRTLLGKIAIKAAEHEQTASEKLRLEVELENAIRAADTKTRLMKNSVEKGLKEASDLRQQLENEALSRQKLESELREIKSSTSSSSSDVAALKARITSLESSNRDTLSVLESKTRAYDDLAGELSAKHQKTLELRHEVTELEQQLRAATAASTSAKFREQGFEQELESLKRSNEWLEQELKTKSGEYSKFRKERNARIAELQRLNEENTTSIESLQRNEKILRARLNEVEQKANDYLKQIKNLRDEATRQEENFRAELDTANRLANLMKNSMNMEKQRQQELYEQLEKLKEEATKEIGRIDAEVQTEHEARIAAENRVAELEVTVERLEADVHAPRLNGSIGPGDSPARVMSPAPSQIRGGLNFTQLLNDYHVARAELGAERRRNDKLSEHMQEMVVDLETRQPEIMELRADHARLEADVVEMSALVDTIAKERDTAKKDTRKAESEATGLRREGEVLRQQLRDLSSQIKVLLVEVNAKDHGLDAFTPDERARLERLAQGDLDDSMSQDMTDTDRFISESLTTFKSVSQLQEQNTKLLRLTRELGNRMEGEEAHMRQSQAQQEREELGSLRQKYERCRDEIKSLVTQSQSYIRERDMFRRMLAHRGQLPPQSDLASMFGNSVNGGDAPATPMRDHVFKSTEQSPNSKDLADYTKLIKEMQSHFDSYKQEAATDRSMLKEEVDGLNRKNGELRTELSKRIGEAMLAVERYEMLQGNYAMLKNENSELQKRSMSLSERFSKQELRVQQVAEDFVEAKALVESMRNETANLKAEKEFWRSVEKRLNEDNRSLVSDRDRLNSLNANLQNLLNEREHTDTEGRRRLQQQIEMAESELQSTKRKLSEELEEVKRTALRREYDNQQYQSRIDDVVTSLGSTREELAAVKTSRDHLQARVEELTIELRSAEDRVEVLQSRFSAFPNNTTSDETDASASGPDKEQELALQASELRRDLELARADLANVRIQVDQYKAISQSSEEELQSLNETQDQYRQEMDRIIGEKETKLEQLHHTIDALRMEVSTYVSEISMVRSENIEHSHKLEDQKTAYEAEVNRLKDLNERSEAAAHYHQEDLKAQAEIAQQAQQNYENELVKHAEAAKHLQKVRTESSQLKLEIVELKAARDAAQTSLSQSEESWAEARDRYERELTEIRSRRDDVNTQNRLLHQQLEQVNKQIMDLQQKRASNIDVNEFGTVMLHAPGTDNLQEVITYLRQEKEIVDVQYELSAQEARRLRQQQEHTQAQLDEARLKLNQQRRAEENTERSALNHNKLLETINELNLIRESNVALRLEKNQVQTSLSEKVKAIEDIQGQLQPLQAKVRELEDLREAQDEDLRMAREARERFEQRYHDVLHKSDSIDPAEFEALKEKIAALEIERNDLLISAAGLQTQVDSLREESTKRLEETNERFAESRKRLIESAKNKAREQNVQIRERDTALQAASQGQEALQSQLQVLQQELDAVKASKAELEAQILQAEVAAKESSHAGSEEGQVAEGSASNPNVDGLSVWQENVQDLERQVTSTRQALEQANQRIAELQAAQIRQSSDQQASGWNEESGELEKLRQELARAQGNAEALRASAAAAEHAVQAEGTSSIAEQTAVQIDAIRADLTAKHEERMQQADETLKKRTEQMKNALTKKLVDGKAELRQAMAAEHEQAIETLKAQHRQEMDSLTTRHQEELNKLRQQTKPEGEPAAVNGDQAVKPEVVAAPVTVGAWKGTMEEARELVRTNKLIREVMQGNIRSHTAKVREECEQSLAEKLAEAEVRSTNSREQAVSMEIKKQMAKLSMAQGQARGLQAKVEYVRKAATETPEKAVSEVWAVAKDVKPPPPPAPTTPVSTLPAPGAPAQPQLAMARTVSGLQASIFNTAPTFLQSSFGQQPPAPGQVQTVDSANGALSNPFTATAAVVAKAPASAAEESRTDGSSSQAASTQQPPRLPDKPLGAGQGGAGGVGVGPTVLRNLQSGLPMPSTGRGQPGAPNQPRGRGNIGGGRGRGAGRGAFAPPQGSPPPINQQRVESPTGGAPLSATAKQFVPTKRPRDEGGLESSHHAGPDKRMRGGK